LKYSPLLADRQPHIVIRGIIGEMGAVRVRANAETRDEARKLASSGESVGDLAPVDVSAC
jgi:hypothetical protein